MRGNDNVVKELNAALHAELTAIVQYMVQAEMCEGWGYSVLGAHIKKQAIEEMGHAEGLIERILFLDGVPAVTVGLKPTISNTAKAFLEDDLKDEVGAVHQYNAAAKVCGGAGDNGTKDLFERMIKDEEGHTDWLEAQLHAISEMGLNNWLARQMKAGG
jgi:bacterioferritin